MQPLCQRGLWLRLLRLPYAVVASRLIARLLHRLSDRETIPRLPPSWALAVPIGPCGARQERRLTIGMKRPIVAEEPLWQ